MPALSIIIPAYNVGQYLSECLESVINQTFGDIEAIVVDDGSTDNTDAIAQSMAARDSRIHVITNNPNQGTHRTRMIGTEHATGEYTFFLDGDDALSPDMCKELIDELKRHPADILHYGLTVIGANDLLEEERQAFETFNNAPTPDSTGLDIVRDIYDEDYGQHVDWRFTQRVYRTELLKHAFSLMTKDRLGRSQDGYECFVVSALAQSYHSYKSCRGYIYYYGRGISGTAMIGASKFDSYCHHFKADFDAAFQFADSQYSENLRRYATGFQHKATEILANDWAIRLSPEDQKAGAQSLANVFGSATACREIYRFIRDKAYALFDANDTTTSIDDLYRWVDIAQSLEPVSEDTDSETLRRYREMRRVAFRHFHDLNDLRQNWKRLSMNANQSIRIFVTTHKTVDLPESNLLQPVQVGMKPGSPRFGWAFHDDDGENISDKNPMYCELTTQYWAWKNVDTEYYGFCHYRRYFNFSNTVYEENPYGEIMDDYIDADAVAKYGLDDRTITDAVQGYDVITTRYGNLKEIIEKHGTPKAVWEAAPKLIDEDLHRMYDILCAMHPDYKQDAIAFLNGNRSCFCNMFIMKKEIFFDYCEWLFPLLEQFEKCTDMTHYSKEALRTPGHLAERLLNIYLMHHKRISSGWKTKELQCVHFTNPEPEEKLSPLDVDVASSSIVPVVFAADDNYVPQLTTTIYSAMVNASSDRFYDVVVLQRNIAWDKQERLRTFFSQRFPNMQLRFTNVDRQVAGVKLTTNNEHISVETYYRFLIQQVLPFYNKVLYLDSDIVINGDIAELFDTELGDNLLAAVHDIDFLGNLNVKHGLRMKYAKSVLKMHDPYSYFQAGVLVLNTRAMREQYTIEEWLTYASNPEYIYNDQDVLNAHCEGKVVFLDWDWNVMHDCGGRVANVFSYAPNYAYDAYMDSRNHPKIIHYAGYEKPWVNPDCDFASIYWRYARETPFYERLLKKVVKANATEPSVGGSKTQRHERAIGEDNKLRTIVDPLLPLGSRRREALKAVGRVVRGRR